MPATTILIATRSEEWARSLSSTIEEAGYHARSVAEPGETGEDIRNAGCALIDWDAGDAFGNAMLARMERIGRVPAIILAGSANLRSALQALRQGAADLLEQPADPAELIPAIEGAIMRAVRSQKLLQDIAQARRVLPALSLREQQIVAGIVAGLTSREIAETVAVSLRTVETSRTRLLGKLGVPNTAALVRLAVLGGLTLPEDTASGVPRAGRGGLSR
ncbi:MAG: LuxR C-terminal-related transcriptional regulator [Hyphomicrobiales bacterium]|uniref:response regulator transcription factor n=1 Tax=Aestuariivirga sp. TaxID=2650926 RepID=UPI0035B44ADC